MTAVPTATLLAGTAVLAVGTLSFRAAGPLLGERLTPGPRLRRIVDTGTVVLLGALVATAALVEGGSPAGVARPVGVLVAGLLAWRRAPFVVVVVSAAVVAAGLRLLGLP
jgi:branched-subunit amino acid transport protein